MSEAADHSPAGRRHQGKGHKKKPCVDCVKESERTGNPIPKRKVLEGGIRCATHQRMQKTRRKNATREQRWMAVYNLAADQYEAIRAFQGQHCCICGRATGRGKIALSIDHDHACCDGPASCGFCIRGLICRPCNSYLGYIRDSVEAAERLLTHLTNPIGRRILDNWDNYYSHGRWEDYLLPDGTAEEPEYD